MALEREVRVIDAGMVEVQIAHRNVLVFMNVHCGQAHEEGGVGAASSAPTAAAAAEADADTGLTTAALAVSSALGRAEAALPRRRLRLTVMIP